MMKHGTYQGQSGWFNTETSQFAPDSVIKTGSYQGQRGLFNTQTSQFAPLDTSRGVGGSWEDESDQPMSILEQGREKARRLSLSDATEYEESGVSEYISKLGDDFQQVFKGTSPRKIAQINSIAREHGWSPEYVDHNYESIMSEVYKEDPVGALDLAENVAEGGLTVLAPLALGAMTMTVGALPTALVAAGGTVAYLGLEKLSELSVKGIQLAKGNDVSEDKAQWRDLAPESWSELSKDLIDSAEKTALFVGSGVGLAKAGKTPLGSKLYSKSVDLNSTIAQKVFRDVSDRVSTKPMNIFVSNEDASAILSGDVAAQTKYPENVVNKLKDEFANIATYGDRSALESALANGVDFNIPSYRITEIVDKPMWAKIKEVANVSPYKKTSVVINDAEVLPGKYVSGYHDEIKAPLASRSEAKYAEEIGATVREGSLKEAVERESSERVSLMSIADDGADSITSKAVKMSDDDLASLKLDTLAEVTRNPSTASVSHENIKLHELIDKEADLLESAVGKIEDVVPPKGLSDKRSNEIIARLESEGVTFAPTRQEMASRISNIKQRVRMLSGQIKVSDVTDTDKAFKYALGLAKRYADNAYRVGIREGSDAAKATAKDKAAKLVNLQSELKRKQDLLKDTPRGMSRDEIASQIDNIKTRIRVSTGQVALENITTERKAFEYAMKFSEKNAKIAFKAGNREGVLAERARMQAIKEEKIVRDYLRGYTRELIDNIKEVKTNLKGLSADTYDKLKPILDSFDIDKLSEGKKVELQNVRDMLNAEGNELIKIDMLPMLEAAEARLGTAGKSLRDMTPDELAQVHDLITDIYSAEVRAKEAWVNGNKVKFTSLVSDIATKDCKITPEQALAKSKVFVDPDVKDQTVAGRIKNKTKYIHKIFAAAARANDTMDANVALIAGEDSMINRSIALGAREAQRETMRVKQAFESNIVKSINEFVKRNDVQDLHAWLSEPRVIDGENYLTRDRFMSLFCHSRIKDNRDAIIQGGFGLRESGDEVFNPFNTITKLFDAVSGISKQELDYIQNVVDPVFHEAGLLVRDNFQERNFKRLPLLDNYMPKSVMKRELSDVKSAIELFNAVKIGVFDGFTKERIKSSKPLYLDGLTEAMSNHVERTSSYIGMGDYAETMAKLFNDKAFRKAVAKTFGEDTLNALEQNVVKIVRPYGNNTALDASKELHHGMQAYLTNISTAMVTAPLRCAANFAAFTMYQMHTDPAYITSSVGELLTNRDALRTFLKSVSPEYRDRYSGGMSPEMSDLYRSWDYIERIRMEDQDTISKLIKANGWGSVTKSTPRKKLLSMAYTGADLDAVAIGMNACMKQAMGDMLAMEASNAPMRPSFVRYLRMVDKDIPTDYAAKFDLSVRYAEYATSMSQNMGGNMYTPKLVRDGGIAGKMIGQFSSATSRMLSGLRMDLDYGKRTGEWGPLADRMFITFGIQGGIEEMIRAARAEIYDREYDFNPAAMVANQAASLGIFSSKAWYSLQSNTKTGGYGGKGLDIPMTLVPNLTLSSAAYAYNGKWGKASDKALEALTISTGAPVWAYRLTRHELKKRKEQALFNE